VPARLAPLSAERLDEARSLVGNEADRPRELLDRVASGTRECMATAAYDDGDRATGVVVYGHVAGAVGAGAILWTAVRPDVRRTGVAHALVDRAVSELHASGARLVVAEVPRSATYEATLHLLVACGFRRESEVADFYGDGVPLVLLAHRRE
jgi:ribosomal protein S18 acetylase RimI-like enzyme